MKIKSVVWYPLELRESVLGEAPERLDAVYVVVAKCKLAILMSDPEVFLVADIDQAVIADPAVGVDYRIKADLSSNKSL